MIASDLLEEATQQHQRDGTQGLGSSVRISMGRRVGRRERRVIYKAEAMEQGTNRRFVVSKRDGGAQGAIRVLRQARGERELDQGL